MWESPASGPVPSLLADTPLTGTSSAPRLASEQTRSGRREPRGVQLPSRSAKKMILMVERGRALRDSLGAVLEAQGFVVVSALTGREAAGWLLKDAPDLVLLDLNLNEENAWTTCEVMEKLSPLTPVIALTAQPNEYGLALRLGIDALMVKPLDRPVLLDKIRQLAFEPRPQRVERLIRANFRTDFLRPKEAGPKARGLDPTANQPTHDKPQTRRSTHHLVGG